MSECCTCCQRSEAKSWLIKVRIYGHKEVEKTLAKEVREKREKILKEHLKELPPNCVQLIREFQNYEKDYQYSMKKDAE